MYGVEPLFLLLWWGDVAAMRLGIAKLLDAHRRVLGLVQRGEATVEMCAPAAMTAAAARQPP